MPSENSACDNLNFTTTEFAIFHTISTDSEEEPLLCKSFPSTATGTLDVFLAMLPYAYASGHHG